MIRSEDRCFKVTRLKKSEFLVLFSDVFVKEWMRDGLSKTGPVEQSGVRFRFGSSQLI